VKEGLLKELISLVRHLADLERTSTAGRVNILGMLLSLVLAVSLSLAPFFATLISLIRPNVSVGAPILELFVLFCLFTIICTLMLGYLEGPRRAREMQPPPEDHKKKPRDSHSEE